MIRLSMKFDSIQPYLRSVSGILKVEDVDIENISMQPIELFKCRIEKTEGMTRYSALSDVEAVPSSLFNTLRPIIDTMLRSYWSGMVLEKHNYQWIFMDDTEESWANISNIETETQEYIKRQRLKKHEEIIKEAGDTWL